MKIEKNRLSTIKATFSPCFQHMLFLAVLLLFQLVHLPQAHADISGTVFADEGVTNVGAGKVVRLLANGVSQGANATDASGNYSIIYSESPGDVLLVYIDGDAIYDGTTVTISNGASLAGLNIYADHLITRQDNGGSLTIANMDTAKGAYADTEILYSIAAGALTVTGANTTLYVPAGHTFAPGGNVNTAHVKINGTCDAQSHTITVSGNWDSNSGTITAGTSSVVLNGTGNLDSTGDAFYNLTVGAATRTTTLRSNLTVNNVLTIADSTGTLTDAAAGYTITLPGGGTPFVNNNAAVSVNRFIYSNTDSSTVTVAGGTYNVTDMLLIGGGNAGAGTPYQLNGNLVVNGKLDIYATSIGISSLDTSVSNYNITATGLTVTSGLFNVGFLYTNGSIIDINGNVLLVNGVVGSVFMDSSYWTVSGNWTNTMTAGFSAQTSTIEFDGAAQTINGNTLFNNFKKIVTSADTLAFAAGSTQTITGTVTLDGDPGQLLSLRSSAPGTRWNFNLNASATKAIDYVAVMDSDASGSDGSQKPVNPTNSINLGNTVSWFPETCPIVTNTNNSGSGSVRACIDYANANPGTTIRFNIPSADPGKQTAGADTWWRIVPLTSLPTITANNTIIDGTTQAAFIGGDPNTLGPEIQLFGNGAAFDGLTITSANNTVKGLIIGRFNTGAGIAITGAAAINNSLQGNYLGANYNGTASEGNGSGVTIASGANANIIGGTVAGAGNLISGNGNGIKIINAGTDSNLIQGNYIGTNALGTGSLQNSWGISIGNGAKSNTIGGTAAGARNVISGNLLSGIDISTPGTDSNVVRGNYIGTDKNGTLALPNLSMGVSIGWLGGGPNFTAIGGAVANAGNVISGNSVYGIYITNAGSDSSLVQGNYIGTDNTGNAALANADTGVQIDGGATSTIGGIAAGAANRIAYNGGDGIGIRGANADGNVFSTNAIYMNTGLGISLAGDGSNNNKATPTITTIAPSGGNFIVIATVPAAGDTIEFFRANNLSSPVVTPDSPAGEGYLFLGSCDDNGGACVGPYVSGSDTNGAAGAVSVTLTGGGLAPVDTLSATATDVVNGTSPFSINKVVPLKLIKQTYDISGACIASSDATDAGCGSTSVVTVPAGVVVKFMIIVKNTSAQAVADVRFEDTLDEGAGGFSYLAGSLFSTPAGASAPADTASNTDLYAAATNALTDGIGDDLGSARDLGGPAGADNVSIGLPINTALSINANKAFAAVFQVRKK